MTLEQIYKTGIEMAVKEDLRGPADVKKKLESHRKEYKELSESAKADFDTELLINPYPDSRIGYGNLDLKVKKVLAGIDIETAEVLLADRLGNIDLIIAHHPQGRALTELNEVMHLQAEVLAKFGVPINVAQGVMRERINEVERKILSNNNEQVIDTARLLNIAFLSAHTTCDNLSAMFIKKQVDNAKPQRVSDVLAVLKTIPEYQIATKNGVGPVLFAGSPNNYAGRVVVTEFTGGTEGSKMMYEKMSQAGIGTIVSMHMSEESRKEAEKNHINVVVAGHISSDSLGMNLFLDELEKNGVEIIPTSGLTRVSRVQKKKPTKKS